MSPTPVSSTILIFYSTATAEATYTYDPYGNTTATTGGTFATSTNPWRYGGGYTDPNGTIKFGARYYNPTTGRFTQPDPSGQESNRYLRRRQPHHQQRSQRFVAPSGDPRYRCWRPRNAVCRPAETIQIPGGEPLAIVRPMREPR
jgi:RHS repeat-associated protein